VSEVSIDLFTVVWSSCMSEKRSWGAEVVMVIDRGRPDSKREK
jgi:hypothetical protein